MQKLVLDLKQRTQTAIFLSYMLSSTAVAVRFPIYSCNDNCNNNETEVTAIYLSPSLHTKKSVFIFQREDYSLT